MKKTKFFTILGCLLLSTFEFAQKKGLHGKLTNEKEVERVISIFESKSKAYLLRATNAKE